jgi:hypothetical protein
MSAGRKKREVCSFLSRGGSKTVLFLLCGGRGMIVNFCFEEVEGRMLI